MGMRLCLCVSVRMFLFQCKKNWYFHLGFFPSFSQNIMWKLVQALKHLWHVVMSGSCRSNAVHCIFIACKCMQCLNCWFKSFSICIRMEYGVCHTFHFSDYIFAESMNFWWAEHEIIHYIVIVIILSYESLFISPFSRICFANVTFV